MDCRLNIRFRERAALLPYLLFAVNQLLKTGTFESLFLRHYLNDLLALPIILHLAVHLRNTLTGKTIPVTRINILFTVLLVSLYFEVYLPGGSAQYTSDPADIVCYFLGALYFERFMS